MKEYIKLSFLYFIKYFFIAISLYFGFILIIAFSTGVNQFFDLFNNFNIYKLHYYLEIKPVLNFLIDYSFVGILLSLFLVIAIHQFILKKKELILYNC